jgi:membrane protease YdiL (CAAX protease family)
MVRSLPRALPIALGMALIGMTTYLFAAGKIGRLPDQLAGLATPTAAVVLIAVAGEEIVYRGFLLTRLVAGFGTHGGIILSGLLFELVHLSRYSLVAPDALAAMPMAAMAAGVSVGAGYAVWAARSSLYGVFLHGAMNMVQGA